MQLSLQLSKLQGTTSYCDENVGRVGVKSDTVILGLSFDSLSFPIPNLVKYVFFSVAYQQEKRA